MTDIAMGLDRDEATSVMSALLAELTAGVGVFDTGQKLRASSPRLATMLGLPGALTRAGATLRDILDHAEATGLLAEQRPTLDLFAEASGGVMAWMGAAGRHLELTVRALPDGVRLALWRDITDQERDRAALREERARMQHMLRNVTDAIVLMDPDGVILQNSDRSGQLVDVPAEFVAPGRTHQDILRYFWRRGDYGFDTPEDEFVQQRRAAILAAGDLTFTTRIPNGTWVEYNFRPMPDRHLLVVVRDITALKHREQELAQARAALEQEGERLHAILDNLPDGVALFSAGGELLHMNPASRELNRFPPAVFEHIHSMRDAMRWQLENGEQKPEPAEIEADLDRRMDLFFSSGRNRREIHRFGRYLDVRWIPLPDGKRLVLHRDITDLREGETELRQAHEATELVRGTMEAVLESMNDSVMLTGEQGEILFSNRAFQVINNVPDDVFADCRTIYDVFRWQIGSGEVAGSRATIEASVADLIVQFEARKPLQWVRPGRDGRWVNVQWLPLPRGRTLVLHRDITDLKRQEQAAAESRALMETVLDNMTDGVMLYDRDEACVYANKSFYRVQESSPERIARLKTFPNMMDALLERGSITEEFRVAALERFRRADGSPKLRQSQDGRWSEGIFHRLSDGGTLGVFRDVTDFMRNEAALREARANAERQHEMLRVMFDNMTDGVILAEADGTWSLVNEALYRINGWPAGIRCDDFSPEAVRGWLEDGVLDRHMATIEEDIDRVRQIFFDATGLPATFHRKNGNWVESRWIALPEDRRLGMFRDITALKRQEERLALERDAAETARAEAEAANQAKSTFLAAMSHEIRTPMNGVLGMMELLERTDLSGDQQRHVVIMRDGAQSLLRIIDDILDFSKIDAGRMDLETLPFSLHGLIAGTVDTFTPQARQKGLALFADPPGRGPDWLDGDPTRVRQILFNLIGNALKFTERGFVRISSLSTIDAGAASVTLTVEDSGIGMDDGQQARLFQPFSQADTSTTRRFGGTGLGLSIVRRLAELMGGTATVESIPGRGSRFIVTLRLGLASASGQELAPVHATRVASGSDRPRLLVADDHPVNREVIQQQLGILGLTADLAADGLEALALWRRHHHGVVLLDIHMPELDGFDVARAIRRDEAAAELPRAGLIAVTANALKGEDERCFAAGMDGFVAKPISLDALSRALSRFVPGLGETDGATVRPSGAAFDPETLRGLFGSDPTRLSRLFETFVEAATGDLATLRTAATNAARAEAAHRLKGAARMVGARLLADQASRVEIAARAEDTAATVEASEGLAAMLAETTTAARASFNGA